MAKQITFDTIARLGGRILFNFEVASQDENGPPEYYPVALQFYCVAKGSGAADRKMSTVIPLGVTRVTPYTPKEIYTRVSAKMGQDVADTIKDLYIEGIADDISI